MDILDLPNWITISKRETGGDYHLIAEYLVKTLACPHCHATNISRNGTRPAFFRDVPTNGDKRVLIEVERQRYICNNCRKSFSQLLPDISETRDATNRLIEYIAKKSTHLSFAHVADEVGVAENMVKDVFVEYTAGLEQTNPIETPVWLGIDEIHISRKYHCVLTNLQLNTAFDFLGSRNKKPLARRISNLKTEDVELVAIDMYRNFKDVIRAVLPRAAIIIDKYHVTSKANEALDEVRKKVGLKLSKYDRIKMMNNRELLLTHRDRLRTDFDRMNLDTWLTELPLLKKAYWVKEEFYGIYKASDTFEAKERLRNWQMGLAVELQPFFGKLLSCLRNWDTEIFAYFDHQPRLTNNFTETLNNLIRHINSNGRGYSFDVLRAKILYGTDASKYRRGILRRPKKGVDYNISTLSTIGWNEPRIEQKPSQIYLGADIKRLIELYERDEI